LTIVLALLLAAAFIPATTGAASPTPKGATGAGPKAPKAPHVKPGLKPTKQVMHGHGKVFDVRKLPKIKNTKHLFERPEPPEPLNLNWNPFRGTEPNSYVKVAAHALAAPPPSVTFEGIHFNEDCNGTQCGAGHPPDTNGDVGPTYYIQTVNTAIGIYDKVSGARVAAFTFDQLMSQGNFGNFCDTDNFGDPVVLYDSFEDRWVITDFAFQLVAGVVTPPHAFECIAVSKTGNPVTGGWNFYSIETLGGLGDYPKLGIWPDGIYMSVNMFNYAGTAFLNPRVYAFNKAQMYAGSATVQVVSFNAPSSDFTILPGNARLQAGTPPAGTPEYFVSTWQFTNALTVYKMHVDWNTTSLSTFTGPDTPISPTSWPNAAVANAPSQGGNNLDVLQIRAMVQNQYSNIGGAESLWVPHTVRRGDVTGFAAPRYYQLNVTGGTVAANTVQAATWDPDGANVLHRFMPSLAVDRVGDMALGYSTSSSTTKPALMYAGRLAADPVNTFSQTEQLLFQGAGTQTGNCGPSVCQRWGDYSAMTLDPDGCTFWYTNEYYAADGLDDHTRIGAFSFPGCTPVGAGGTLSGTVTVNPGGAPISGATVLLGSRSTTTNGSGQYSFTGLPAGTYTAGMTASAPGYDDGTAGTQIITDGGTTTQDFSLVAAATSGCFTDTTQADFLVGSSTGCDLNASPGDVILSRVVTVDQQQLSTTTSGTGLNTTQWLGQTFVPGITGSLSKIDMDLFCASCSGANPAITVEIRTTSGGLPTSTVLASTTIPGFSSGAGIFYTATFASPAAVTAGTQYAYTLRILTPRTGTYAAVFSPGPTSYASGDRVVSTTSGASWTIPTSTGTARDLVFSTYVDTGFGTTGTFISSVKDANPIAGRTPTWTTLSWNATTPAGTSVQFQVAGSNAEGGPFSFVGPDSTSGTFFTTSGADLSQFDGFRYLKYKAILTSSDPSQTPTLNDVTVCFVDAGADLVVTKSHTATRVEIGRPFSYTVQVKNNGPVAAQNVHLTDLLPTSMTFVSSSVAGGLVCTTPTVGTTGPVDCTLGSLGNGNTASVVIKVRPTTVGLVDNTASVTSTTVDEAPGDESDTDSLTVQTNSKGCTIVGTGGVDTITGTGGADVICGMAGADHLDGAGGGDTLYGQSGGDTLFDHSGLDKLFGGPGADDLNAADGAGSDLVDGQGGTDTCSADPGDTVKHCP
jgi:uncharacterized repeat protein (TIGR01451 family)